VGAPTDPVPPGLQCGEYIRLSERERSFISQTLGTGDTPLSVHSSSFSTFLLTEMASTMLKRLTSLAISANGRSELPYEISAVTLPGIEQLRVAGRYPIRPSTRLRSTIQKLPSKRGARR
jgi:hypothetical protein